MNHDSLLRILKNGETFTATTSEGESYQVVRPPTKYSLAAAALIEKLVSQLQNDQAYLTQLQHERDQAYLEINQLKQGTVQNVST